MIAPLFFSDRIKMADDKKVLLASYRLKNVDVLIDLVKHIQKTSKETFKAGERFISPVTYFWPDYYDQASKWSKTLMFGNRLGVVILNRNSGDWEHFDENFKVQAALARLAGVKRIVFYVKTQYGVAKDPVKLGKNVPNPEKFTKEYILNQIAFCKKHYGDLVDGVFLDEFISGWEDTKDRLGWYRDLTRDIRSIYGDDFTIVGNCGTRMHESVLDLDVDIFMSFESSADKYLSLSDSDIHAEYMRTNPGNRFWHVVHGVTDSQIADVFAKAERLGIGHLYVTNGILVEGAGGQWNPDVNQYAVTPSDKLMDMTSSWVSGNLKLQLSVDKLINQSVVDVKFVDGGLELSFMNGSKKTITQ